MMASPTSASIPQNIYSILQYLESVNLKETARTLERESGFFLNVGHFEELFLRGAFDEAEKYISGFTSLHDNIFSTRIIFEIRKQKYLEALDNGDKSKAVTIIMKELKVFQRNNDKLVKEATDLLMMDSIRKHPMLTYYVDTATARKVLMNEIKKYILMNPVLRGSRQISDSDYATIFLELKNNDKGSLHLEAEGN